MSDANPNYRPDFVPPDATLDDPNRKPVDAGNIPPDAGKPARAPEPTTRPGYWLCAFEVKVDLPATLFPGEMEAAIADCLAVRLPALGHPGNVIVSLLWTSDGSVLASDDPATRRLA